MNPDKQRIAIAEACGWHFESLESRMARGDYTTHAPEHAKKFTSLRMPNGTVLLTTTNEDATFEKLYQQLPKYLSDLNKMHAAEETLNERKHEEFRINLSQVALRAETSERSSQRNYASPTAAQRAEAFLRTVGTWEDEPERMNTKVQPTPAENSTTD